MRATFGLPDPRRSAPAWPYRLGGFGACVLGNDFVGDTLGTAAIAINTLLATPLISAQGYALNTLLFEVTVAGGAGSVARVGIYDTDLTTFLPRTLRFDGGEFVTTGIGVKQSGAAGIRLLPDSLYWLVYLCGVAAPTIRIGNGLQSILGHNTGNLSSSWVGWSVAQAYGALPAAWPAGAVRLFGGYPLVGAQLTT